MTCVNNVLPYLALLLFKKLAIYTPYIGQTETNKLHSGFKLLIT